MLTTAAGPRSAGATAAGPAMFAQAITHRLEDLASRSRQARVQAPKIRRMFASLVRSDISAATGHECGAGATAANNTVSAQAALGLSGVRAQIKNKLEGLKQI